MTTTNNNLEALRQQLAALREENRQLRDAPAKAAWVAAERENESEGRARLAARKAAKPKAKRAKAAKVVEIRDIRDRDRTHKGRVHPGTVEAGNHADIVVGESIRLFGEDAGRHPGDPKPYDKTFKIGDTAEYDSWNLHYLGTITGIGAKTVTIESPHGGKAKRLSIYEFNWRNKRLDVEEIRERNAETSLHI